MAAPAEQRSVLKSLANLRSYSWIRERVERGSSPCTAGGSTSIPAIYGRRTLRQVPFGRRRMIGDAHGCPGAPVGLSLGSAYRFRKRWERFFPAVAVVCRVELLNGCVSLGTGSHSSTLSVFKRPARPGFATGGRSSAAWNARHCASSSRNRRRLTKASSAAFTPASSRNSVTPYAKNRPHAATALSWPAWCGRSAQLGAAMAWEPPIWSFSVYG